MASNEKYTILYGRLSQEDTQKTNKTDDSNSIQNQKLLLEKYATEKGFTNTLFLYDDGYSGTNFNRPGWQQVMELMENGQVETLIVKDMSRLGREYLQVGQYTELIFFPATVCASSPSTMAWTACTSLPTTSHPSGI